MAAYAGDSGFARYNPHRGQAARRTDPVRGGAACGVPFKGAQRFGSSGGLRCGEIRQEARRRKARNGDIHEQPHSVRHAGRGPCELA